ncbi:hypothetical protein ACGFIV_01565 [Sphaerisporangium sp. NPDC049003]
MSSPPPRARRQPLKEPAAPRLKTVLSGARLPEHDLVDDGTYRSMEFGGA